MPVDNVEEKENFWYFEMYITTYRNISNESISLRNSRSDTIQKFRNVSPSGETKNIPLKSEIETPPPPSSSSDHTNNSESKSIASALTVSSC